MPKKAREMTPTEVRHFARPGRHAVGGVPGLLLEVHATGNKAWVLRARIGDRRRHISLGGFPEISLALAREKARMLKDEIRKGIDPLEQRETLRAALARGRGITFADAAARCHKVKAATFKDGKNKKLWLASIELHANPHIGPVPVKQVELPQILQVLEPIWTEKPETAMRLRQRLEAVLDWATVAGHRKGDNPARWKGFLDQVLPSPQKLHKKKSFPSMPWQSIGGFVADLRQRKGSAARCLEFCILTASRSGEARLATWSEIDFDKAVWTIPGERMKAGKQHRVPLSKQAMELLKALPKFQESDFVFPAARGGALSDMALSMVCRRMKIEAVPHGFRATFRNWCAESTNYPREIAELSLAHAIKTKTEAAYFRSDLLEKRRPLMAAWADFCDRQQAGAEAVPIRRAKND
ncbi:MAG: integrase arm-type DNA-binding domain-containing protein [Desulfatibacillaceae bacterium]|nr:integrase arm-type DNA-binding domain-containing protein [Desulfatibacillaceae bacterium]